MQKKNLLRFCYPLLTFLSVLLVFACGWFDDEKNFSAPTELNKISAQTVRYLWQEKFHYIQGDSTRTSSYDVDLVPDSLNKSWANNLYTLEVRLTGEELILWRTTVKSQTNGDTIYFSPLDMSSAPRVLAKSTASSAFGTTSLPRLPMLGSSWVLSSGLLTIKKSLGTKELVKIGKSNYEVWAVAESVYIDDEPMQVSIYRYGSKGLIQSEQKWEIPMAMSADGDHLGPVEITRTVRLR